MKFFNIPVFLMTFGLAVHSYAAGDTTVIDGDGGGTARAGTVVIDGSNTGADDVDGRVVVVDSGIGIDDAATDDDARACSPQNLSALQKVYLDQFAEKHYCYEDGVRMAKSMVELLSGFRQGRITMANSGGGTIFHPDELTAYSLAGYRMKSFLVIKHKYNSKRLIIVNLRHPSGDDTVSEALGLAIAEFHEVARNYPSDEPEVEAAITAVMEAGVVVRNEGVFNETLEQASVQVVFESMEITEGFQTGWYLFDPQ